jgi:hypothetical protein
LQSLINITWAFATLLGAELRQQHVLARTMFGHIRDHIITR